MARLSGRLLDPHGGGVGAPMTASTLSRRRGPSRTAYPSIGRRPMLVDHAWGGRTCGVVAGRRLGLSAHDFDASTGSAERIEPLQAASRCCFAPARGFGSELCSPTP